MKDFYYLALLHLAGIISYKSTFKTFIPEVSNEIKKHPSVVHKF